MRIRSVSAALALAAVLLHPLPASAAAGTTYYLDAANGSDAASGTSETSAWRTLAKASAQTFGPGDRILLKAGGIWSGQYLDLRGSGAAGAPIVLDRYGTGPKPVIDFADTAVGGEGFGVRLRNVSYWEIGNLEITSGEQPTDRRRSGVLVVGEGTGAGNFTHVHVRNVDVHDVFGTDRRTGGINFHARGTDAQPESTWSDVLIEGNTVVNVADTGIQTMTDAFFNSSWTHRYDAFSGVVIRNNHVERVHRDGILVRAGRAPLVEYNTTSKIGASTTSTLPYLDRIAVVAAQWPYYATDAVFQYNEASETRRLDGDGQPWDFDQFVYRSVYQYNYSHDNEGGTLLVMNDTDDNVFRYNVSQNDLDRSTGAFHLISTAGDLRVYNNVFYRSQGQTGPLTGAATGANGKAYYTNNIFYNLGNGGYTTGGNAVYSHNLFYGNAASTPSDPNKIIADPRFVNPGGATGRATADAYKLRQGSPAIDSGVAVTGNGGRDFFGTTLYLQAPDRGVHESAGAAPVVLFSDDFADGDAAGWTTAGGTWSATGGGYAQTAATGESIAHAGSAAWSGHSYQARVRIDTAGGNAGLLFRYADSGDFYHFRLNDTGDRAELYKRVGGTLTLVASAATAVTAGRFHTLRVTVAGNNVKAFVDGAQKLDWTNPATELTAGRIGLRAHSTAAVFDDVAVTE
ncbi:hypothetical protein GCM10023085_62800 [Actinomadura viridis]|uniref:3-keto-alpha-glucoside-1,2-lyase/3-keto-2-hydroxy-glucal hydratase domain-containing protein n=1 Tax=Actinomadura viridis TaxID=58110 RepID=A0A931DCM0_9ACTN|nr:family 16 glycoside hydrolase [Actinomadura viridis]MBG6086128.1 hypothetical protein [Actinomadura viridis]